VVCIRVLVAVSVAHLPFVSAAVVLQCRENALAAL